MRDQSRHIEDLEMNHGLINTSYLFNNEDVRRIDHLDSLNRASDLQTFIDAISDDDDEEVKVGLLNLIRKHGSIHSSSEKPVSNDTTQITAVSFDDRKLSFSSTSFASSSDQTNFHEARAAFKEVLDLHKPAQALLPQPPAQSVDSSKMRSITEKELSSSSYADRHELESLSLMRRDDCDIMRQLVTSVHEKNSQITSLELQLGHFQLQVKALTTREIQLEQETDALRFHMEALNQDKQLLEAKLQSIAGFELNRPHINTADSFSSSARTPGGLVAEIRGHLLEATDHKISDLMEKLHDQKAVLQEVRGTAAATIARYSSDCEALNRELQSMSDQLAQRTVLYSAQERRWRDVSRTRDSKLSEQDESIVILRSRLQQLQEQFDRVDKDRMEAMLQLRQKDIIVVELEQKTFEFQERVVTLDGELAEASAQNLSLQMTVDRLRGWDGLQDLEQDLAQEVNVLRQDARLREEILRRQLSDAEARVKSELSQREALMEQLQSIQFELNEKIELLRDIEDSRTGLITPMKFVDVNSVSVSMIQADSLADNNFDKFLEYHADEEMGAPPSHRSEGNSNDNGNRRCIADEGSDDDNSIGNLHLLQPEKELAVITQLVNRIVQRRLAIFQDERFHAEEISSILASLEQQILLIESRDMEAERLGGEEEKEVGELNLTTDFLVGSISQSEPPLASPGTYVNEHQKTLLSEMNRIIDENNNLREELVAKDETENELRHALAEKGRQLGIILRRAAELNIMPNNNQQHQIVHGNHFIHNDSESRQMVLNPHGNAIVSPGSISPLIQATALTSTNQQLCSDDLNNLKAHKAAMDECHDTIARLGQENDFLQEQLKLLKEEVQFVEANAASARSLAKYEAANVYSEQILSLEANISKASDEKELLENEFKQGIANLNRHLEDQQKLHEQRQSDLQEAFEEQQRKCNQFEVEAQELRRIIELADSALIVTTHHIPTAAEADVETDSLDATGGLEVSALKAWDASIIHDQEHQLTIIATLEEKNCKLEEEASQSRVQHQKLLKKNAKLAKKEIKMGELIGLAQQRLEVLEAELQDIRSNRDGLLLQLEVSKLNNTRLESRLEKQSMEQELSKHEIVKYQEELCDLQLRLQQSNAIHRESCDAAVQTELVTVTTDTASLRSPLLAAKSREESLMVEIDELRRWESRFLDLQEEVKEMQKWRELADELQPHGQNIEESPEPQVQVQVEVQSKAVERVLFDEDASRHSTIIVPVSCDITPNASDTSAIIDIEARHAMDIEQLKSSYETKIAEYREKISEKYKRKVKAHYARLASDQAEMLELVKQQCAQVIQDTATVIQSQQITSTAISNTNDVKSLTPVDETPKLQVQAIHSKLNNNDSNVIYPEMLSPEATMDLVKVIIHRSRESMDWKAILDEVRITAEESSTYFDNSYLDDSLDHGARNSTTIPNLNHSRYPQSSSLFSTPSYSNSDSKSRPALVASNSPFAAPKFPAIPFAASASNENKQSKNILSPERQHRFRTSYTQGIFIPYDGNSDLDLS